MLYPTGVGGVVVPVIVEVLLRKYGHRVTLLSLVSTRTIRLLCFLKRITNRLLLLLF
jgi:hypothetical protein